MTPEFWTAARAQMLLDPEVVNLNTGSWGPTPRRVFERANELRRRLAEEPMDFYLRRVPPLLWEARQRLATFLGTDPRRLVFTTNVSVAINILAASLRLSAPGEVLLTDHEYGAMHWCWERACVRQGLTLRTFPLPVTAREPGEIVQAFRDAISDRTRLLFFSHVLSPTGLVLPAKEICEVARKRGVLSVVDGAHAPAMIPLSLTDVAADFYCGNCHKWLLAPSGTGFLWFGPGNEDRLAPLQVSWGWHHARDRMDEPDEFGSTPRIRALEFEGSRDLCPWLAVPAAIDFQTGLGWTEIRGRMEELACYTRQRLSRLTLWTPEHPALHGSLTAFRLPAGVDAAVLRRRLWEEHRIEIPVIERPDGYLIRVSTHFYNTEWEIDRLTTALEKLVPLQS